MTRGPTHASAAIEIRPAPAAPGAPRAGRRSGVRDLSGRRPPRQGGRQGRAWLSLCSVSGRPRPGEESRQVQAGNPARVPPPARPATALRDPPPPLEANDQLVTAVITAGWAVALVVLLIVRSYIPPGQRWWIWTALAGLLMCLFGLWYVPYLKRARARSAQRRAGRRD